MSDCRFQVQLECLGGTAETLRQAIELARALALSKEPPLVLITEPGVDHGLACTTIDDLNRYFEKKEVPDEHTDTEDGSIPDPDAGGGGGSGQVPL